MDYAVIDQRNATRAESFLLFFISFVLGLATSAAIYFYPSSPWLAAFLAIIFVLVAEALYFIPAIIAVWRVHHNAIAITAVNFLLGWNIIGWIAALIWACTATRST